MKGKKRWINSILLLILALYPLRHIWLGVELTDSAYSAGNYRYLDRMNPMWLFSTYLANKTGACMTGMPFGNRLMGLNFYTALVLSLLAVLLYLFLVRKVRLQPYLAFFAELLALSLCWCPTTILYNSLTYLFFNLATVLLYLGLTREKRVLMLLAGVLLGLNLFVRFPNLAEGLLIVTVWYYGFLMKKRFRDVLKDTGMCLAGFAGGVLLVLLQIAGEYGLPAYAEGIRRLLNMPSNASDYSLYSMILTVLLDYKASARWLLCMAALTLVGLGIFAVGRGRAQLLKKILFTVLVGALFFWWYRLGVFNLRYYTYESMFQWVAVFLLITMVFALYDLISGKISRNQKLTALMTLVILAVTPLGSNNHLYPNINNMFLVFPFTFSGIHQLFRGRYFNGDPVAGRFSGATWKLKKREFATFPAAAMLLLFVAALSVQSLGFGAVFTFRDGMSGQKRDTKIENNDILKGMVTNRELADQITGLSDYAQQQALSGHKVILYGQIPAVSYFLQMEPAISTSWPDLRSYDISVMQADLQQLTETPVIILSAKTDAFLTDDAQGEQVLGVTQQELAAYRADPKLKLLSDYMAQNHYQETYTNTAFAVYQKL